MKASSSLSQNSVAMARHGDEAANILTRGSEQSLNLSHVRQLSCSFTRAPQLHLTRVPASSDPGDPFAVFESRLLHRFPCSSPTPHLLRETCLCMCGRAPFAFASSPEVHFVARSEVCQGSVSCSRCPLQSFFIACLQPRISGSFHPLQMFQKARIWRFVAAVEE